MAESVLPVRVAEAGLGSEWELEKCLKMVEAASESLLGAVRTTVEERSV